jgi:DNA-binding NarL/FixJ family response regulator
MYSEKVVNIAIAEDHNVFRKILADALQYSDNNFDVVFHVSNGLDLINELRKNQIDVVIIDLNMPIMSGDEAIDIILSEFPNIKIIILSFHNDIDLICDYFTKGVNSFLPKECDIEDLIDAIYSVMNIGYYINENFNLPFRKMIQQNKFDKSRNEKIVLSVREIEIIKLTCLELCSKEISERLFISIRTVENYRHRIGKKLGINNSIGLVLYALFNGIVQISSSGKIVSD